MPDDDDVWFEQKTFGYGAGLPVAWQGWVLLIGYVAAVAGMGFALMPRHTTVYYTIVAAMTVAVLVVAARHTRGGWRWRW